MELLWRMNRSDQSKSVAESLPAIIDSNPRDLDAATDYQIRLMAELGWRYKITDLTTVSEPHLVRIEEISQQSVQRQRAIEIAQEQGRYDQAIESAGQLYQDTGTQFSALLHMRLLVEAMRSGQGSNPEYDSAVQSYLALNSDNIELRKTPGYWSLVAQYHLDRGEPEMATKAYESALDVSPNSPAALTGLIWMHIARNDHSKIRLFVERYETLALCC